MVHKESVLKTSMTCFATAPVGAGAPPAVQLPFNMQHQQQTEWCWSATTVSIADYYERPTRWSQCSLVNAMFGLNTCCTNGGSSDCNRPWYPDRALTLTNHLSRTAMGKPTFGGVAEEISHGNPVSVNIQWHGGGGHNPAVSGYDTSGSTLTIDDPWYGRSYYVPYNTFPDQYNGGADWYESYMTK